MNVTEKENEQKIYDYVLENVKDKDLISKLSVKGSQFKPSKFTFSGACSGCGETAYIKLLTQLFGDNLVIANATGCSSIYGASAPVTPYEVPWASSLFEDNAEYGYGIKTANEVIKNRILKYMMNNLSENNLYQKWIDNCDNYEITNEIYDKIKNNLPPFLEQYRDYLVSKSVWIIGGDGWAYDIGFSGIDHVLASNDNVNILVLDSQVYSNTGGQSSKASPLGTIAAFTSSGKTNGKKDLAAISLCYKNAYVAQVSLGANASHLIKVLNEASNYNGPSIILAYTPCIAHGIKGGLENSIEISKQATNCGYYPIFHYNPLENKFYLDSKKTDFDLYEDFLNKQTRYSMLSKVNPSKSKELLNSNKENAIKRYEYYKKLDSDNVK